MLRTYSFGQILYLLSNASYVFIVSQHGIIESDELTRHALEVLWLYGLPIILHTYHVQPATIKKSMAGYKNKLHTVKVKASYKKTGYKNKLHTM